MGPAIDRIVQILAALSGLIAVSFGAFGAHALSEKFSPDQAEWWQTASLYLLLHAGAAVGLAALGRRLAALLMICGALWFAGMLYAMALGAPNWFGALVPIGGLGMLTGWAALLIGALRSR